MDNHIDNNTHTPKLLNNNETDPKQPSSLPNIMPVLDMVDIFNNPSIWITDVVDI